LIRHRHGDIKKLREIRDTIRHDNFITADNKNYVESLITMYLKNQPFAKPSSRQQSDTKIKLRSKSTASSLDSARVVIQQQMSKSVDSSTFSSNKKFGIFGGVGAAAAIAIIMYATLSSGGFGDVTTGSAVPLLVDIDQDTYQRADIISISGNSKSASTQSVELSIENTSGVKIWNENINPKKDGQFSTLVIAGGGGWENGGTYILKAAHSGLASEIEFEFFT
jgi:hypothetical protein